MKRFRIWLKELSLAQQLFAIVFFVVTIFTVFLFVFLANNVDVFVNNQMYSVIQRSQDNLLKYYVKPENVRDINKIDDVGVYHILYEKNSRIFKVNDTSILNDELIVQIEEVINNMNTTRYQGSLYIDKEKTLFIFREFDIDKYLVSGLNNNFRKEFRLALLSSIINLNVWVIIILFSSIMVWLLFLIHPLNLIRAYIEKIKDGQEATLKIDRNDEIGEVAKALVIMQDELKRQEIVKEEMIHNISHDLKTPIATIKSYGESIKDGIYPYGNLETSVDVIIEHANRLEKKVYSLLMLNRMEYLMENTAQQTTVNMKEVTEKVVMAIKMIKPTINITMDLKDVYFYGDEEPWRIVVENLLDNALRYSKSIIHITLNEEGLAIYNDGSTLSQDLQKSIFKPYEKGVGGQFGLGLSIVRKVCMNYHYQVIGENVNNGVVFRIYETNATGRKKI